jgi:hypothetical protein
MEHIVGLCPEIFLGRYLAVTSIDSSDPWLTEKQKVGDWQIRSGIVYSPHLTTTEELFYQRDGLGYPGYDEWYLFDEAPHELGERFTANPFVDLPRPKRLVILVGYPDLALHDPGANNPIVEIFWKQLEWVKPESFVADGQDCLTFVTRNEVLFGTVYERLKAVLPK